MPRPVPRPSQVSQRPLVNRYQFLSPLGGAREDASKVRAVETFVARHFSFHGSLRLHRAALGWDLLRAPANVALAPAFLASRLVAVALSLVGLRRTCSWFSQRSILFRTAVARTVEDRVSAELLPVAVEAGPEVRIHRQQLLDDYTTVRSAVAEIATTLLVLIIGYCLFRMATPGVISLAPVLSAHVAQTSAIESFPLGQRLGAAWYGVFPVELPILYVVLSGVGLAMAASLITTFAGVVTDPLQVRAGLHQRRLLRLLARADATDTPPEIAREHLLARLADASDMLVSLVRALRQ